MAVLWSPMVLDPHLQAITCSFPSYSPLTMTESYQAKEKVKIYYIWGVVLLIFPMVAWFLLWQSTLHFHSSEKGRQFNIYLVWHRELYDLMASAYFTSWNVRIIYANLSWGILSAHHRALKVEFVNWPKIVIELLRPGLLVTIHLELSKLNL